MENTKYLSENTKSRYNESNRICLNMVVHPDLEDENTTINRAIWLAQQQGYRREQVEEALEKRPDGDLFLQSLVREIKNCESDKADITFLISLPQGQVAELSESIERSKEINEPQGYVVINKDTRCGLYNPFWGSSSQPWSEHDLGIRLCHDIQIPFACIDSILPDGFEGESISDVCGLEEDCWRSDAIVEVEVIKKQYNVKTSSQYQKDLKRIERRGHNLALLKEVLEILINGEILPEKYENHNFTGNYDNCSKCHITPDWLLVYKRNQDELKLFLIRTGTHSDLF